MSHLYPGRLIVLEGGEGVGKTTQRHRFAEFYRGQGFEVVETREPGGTPFAEMIRDLTHRITDEPKHPLTEALLMYASRNQHLAEVIIPALQRGAIVICDRFVMSSYVYQGHAGRVDLRTLDILTKLVVGDLRPDLEFVFNATYETTRQRLNKDIKELGVVPDHFESKAMEFHYRVLSGYAGDCGEWSFGTISINADVDADQVFAQCMPYLMEVGSSLRARPKPAEMVYLCGRHVPVDSKWRIVLCETAVEETVPLYLSMYDDGGFKWGLDSFLVVQPAEVIELMTALSEAYQPNRGYWFRIEQFPFGVDDTVITYLNDCKVSQ